MAIIRVKNPIPNVRENPQTYTTTAVSATATSLPIASASGFTTNRYLQIGDTGVEQTELSLASSVSASPFTVAALVYAHPANTPVYEMRYNKVKIYRMRASVETNIATIDMQPGAPYTVYTDTDTLGGDTYASSFYNSTSGDETSLTDYLSITGHAYNSYYGIITRAQELYDDLAENSVSRTMWGNWLNEGVNDLYKAVQMKDQGYGLTTTEITDVTDLSDDTGTTGALPTGFRSMKSVWVKYDGEYRDAYPEEVDEANPQSLYSSSAPFWSYDGDSLVVRPYQAQAIKLRYHAAPTRMTDDSDTPPTPVSFYDDALLDYMMLRAYQHKADTKMIAVFLQQYREKKQLMQREVSQRNKGKQEFMPRSIRWAETRDSNRYI